VLLINRYHVISCDCYKHLSSAVCDSL